ncbi:MAG: Cupin domain protein [Chloroflexi bacterium]|nr:MAG: Cupin domain protein [Chloroflexota bacterium]
MIPQLGLPRRTPRRASIFAILVAAVLVLAACGDGDVGDEADALGAVQQSADEGSVADTDPAADSAPAVPSGTEDAEQDSNLADMVPVGGGGGELSMGANALGDGSTTVGVAQGLVDIQPGAVVVWSAYRLELGEHDLVEGTGASGFLYVVAGNVAAVAGELERALVAQEGVLVNAGVPFSLRAVGGPATVWDIRLRTPMVVGPPDYAPDAEAAWRSEPLRGIPALPLAVMALVTVPPGGETTVHTHPGPEFIVVTAGQIDYQNAFKDAPAAGVGTTETIAAGVAVQKRNRFEADGVFLSLFLLDAGQPFASASRFDGGEEAEDGEANLAALANGGRVVEVSSAFGGAGLDETWGGNSAIDGDPSTQWSSAGDGDEAWIEIALAERTRLTRIGFWTRTMGTSAEIRSFHVVAEDGSTYGPFALSGPTDIAYFDVDFTAQRLRFEAVATSTGNTGAVEIEVYGTPGG